MCIVFLLVDIALMKLKIYILFVAESLMLVKKFPKIYILFVAESLMLVYNIVVAESLMLVYNIVGDTLYFVCCGEFNVS